MHKIALTTEGQELATKNLARQGDDLQLYSDDSIMPGRDGVWTVADDLLILLNSFEVYAISLSFDDQLAAVSTAAGPVHTKRALLAAFGLLCDLQLVEHEMTPNDNMQMLSEFFGVMANPDRLAMVFAMMYRIHTMSDLKVLIGKEASSIYHHLRKLSDVGLVFSLGHGEGYMTNTSVMATCIHALVVAITPEVRDEDN